MNKIIFNLLLLTSINAYALSDCPSSQSVKWHNCFGSFYYENLDVYMGEWKDGKFHGQGNYTWPTGQKYVGEFKDNKYHGRGIFSLSDGRKLDGYFKDDRYIPHICKELTISIYNPEYLKCINELIKEVTGEDSFLKLLDYIDEKN